MRPTAVKGRGCADMLLYVIKRFLLMIPTLFGVLLLTFAVIQFVPGGPVEQMVSQLQGRDGGGEGASGPALSPFGPLRADLITNRITQDRALSESLNDLERRIDDLRFRFFTVLDTFTTDIKPRVEAGTFFLNTDIIKE